MVLSMCVNNIERRTLGHVQRDHDVPVSGSRILRLHIDHIPVADTPISQGARIRLIGLRLGGRRVRTLLRSRFLFCHLRGATGKADAADQPAESSLSRASIVSCRIFLVECCAPWWRPWFSLWRAGTWERSRPGTSLSIAQTYASRLEESSPFPAGRRQYGAPPSGALCIHLAEEHCRGPHSCLARKSDFSGRRLACHRRRVGNFRCLSCAGPG